MRGVASQCQTDRQHRQISILLIYSGVSLSGITVKESI
jgi:hypothetical protein